MKPQPGPQRQFLRSRADIAIYGGAAGGGKTWCLLAEPLYHIRNREFGAVVFRRTYPEIMSQGGLWDESLKVYPHTGATPSKAACQWVWSGGGKVSFSHLQHDTDVLRWMGSQIPLIEFDELTHFSESTFCFLLSRNRSTCGVKPYVRATCNPDPNSWVLNWIRWWIDERTGLPIPERSGVIRWFIRVGDALRWGNDPHQLAADNPGTQPKSFTFIPAKLSDNKILEQADPGYRANLLALPTVLREQLLGGNWKISLGNRFRQEWFGRWEHKEISGYRLTRHDLPPKRIDGFRQIIQICDPAASERSSADWTVVGTFGITQAYDLVWLHALRFQKDIPEIPAAIEANYRYWKPAYIGIEAVASNSAVMRLCRRLPMVVVPLTPGGNDKLVRATQAMHLAHDGRIFLPTDASWLAEVEREVFAFTGIEGKDKNDDCVDVLSYACDALQGRIDRQGASRQAPHAHGRELQAK